MTQPWLFAILVAGAALLPLADSEHSAAAPSGFPGWPSLYAGRQLTSLPLAPEDAWLARQLPGRIARFSDGKRHIVLRWVSGPTRLLHPAQQCFRGAGYSLTPLPMRRVAGNATMSCFLAERGGTALRVCERIIGSNNRSWSDVSSWYWHARLLNSGGGGYWAIIEVERQSSAA